ncbi:hypothetical protein CEUSTIGMA_g1309.t1 [Chlamydomonas eustigma]|uniref:RING-CH-type domain-containing protein n=1 Tax=Chlamydomonas eustigma TaxID=1157962 RepID=A0A250WT28_9CHLO|nr:hypothetical protein CEUSTIGMA_g1309.t1 [Chlamydomonas eustigma]|eukprot:GAX73859.1 hypothetical protein CEUSTIGMA_g1309.t1 [Chlamydomonas eustigma]
MRSRLPEPYLRAFDVEDGTICCRICLDSLNASDLSSGLAIKLGCRCSASGFDVMHRSCAAQWFGSIHQSSKCEVCSSEAVGLPTDVKDKIRSGTSSTTSLHPGPEAAPIATILDQLSSFPSVPAFLGNYSAFCLLPATITCITLTLFYMKVIEVDNGTGIGLTIGISALTILHWFLFPRK